jgi:NAD(P)-dependent dehydrogenase (short-subunit alcohol dehydrogenase family)
VSILEDLFGLSGKLALVTGAGSGLGQVIAEGFAQAGARVICADIQQTRVDEVVKAIGAAGGRAEPCQLDVANEESVTAAFRQIGQPQLDILVNFAGVAAVPARTHELSIEDWHRVVSINLTGTFLVTRAALPRMLEGGGSIINVASVLGIGGYYPDFPSTGLHYAASKAGVIGLTRQLAIEYAADQIRANVIAPGWHFGTRLGEFRRQQSSAEEQERFIAEIMRRIPMKRTGEPAEILGLALYLASPASQYVTGQLITQDGGWTAC